jgi:hypothetical protein
MWRDGGSDDGLERSRPLMSKDKVRWAAERSASSVEWYLNRPNADGALADDPYLVARAAQHVLGEMEAHYQELGEWAEAAEAAAEAEAAFQIAHKWGATGDVLGTLRANADRAIAALANTPGISADEPEKVLQAYATMKKLSATRTDDY